MNKYNIELVKDVANELLSRIKNLEDNARMVEDSGYYYSSKFTGAVRRQSMELTRALAELRKP